MLLGILLPVAVVVLCLSVDGTATVTEGFIRADFEQNFHKKCDKYQFVHDWYRKLENTGDKYFHFVFHENRLKNGGFGDRIAGLISAVAMAARFNRTLLIESSNGFDQIFRPYHPKDIHDPNPKYTWANWTSWSNYNRKFANNDNTEYDLWMCINHGTSSNDKCSMAYSDVRQPIVKLRCNRAYLCYWRNHPGLPAAKEMSTILGIRPEDNLFEVAGCMMRLAMWPTPRLWEEVDAIYAEYEDSLASIVRRQLLQESTTAKEVEKSFHLQTLKHSSSIENNKSILTIRNESTAVSKVVNRKLDTLHTKYAPVFQLGLHFRCGDKSYIMKGAYDNSCVHDATGDNPHKESDYMRYGTPVDIGRCANEVLQNYSSAALENFRRVQRAAYHSGNNKNDDTFGNDLALDFWPNAMAFIASDNNEATKQMESYISHPYTMVSPQGCHIEMNETPECTIPTIGYWFVLSLSDILVVQTQDRHPISAFSRYAGVYNLGMDVFRDAKDCRNVFRMADMSKGGYNGNWFC